ncbi:hypothetical protein GGR55DRAFT_646998 [Xylaria sp. FL0064]|nr:hypothetical protein GGR55DRAFT_646998 [Xylaria sp. FL0064]
MTDTAKNVSLLFYRVNFSGQYEVLVRNTTEFADCNIPGQELDSPEPSIDCAMRVAQNSLGISLEQDQVSVERSVKIGTMKGSVRVFMIRATPEVEALAERGDHRGWYYAFVPVEEIEDVYLTRHIEVGGPVVKAALTGQEIDPGFNPKSTIIFMIR